MWQEVGKDVVGSLQSIDSLGVQISGTVRLEDVQYLELKGLLIFETQGLAAVASLLLISAH